MRKFSRLLVGNKSKTLKSISKNVRVFTEMLETFEFLFERTSDKEEEDRKCSACG